ncbi:hypothetical protein B0H16DRAFT_1459387 [Mycena metata]|uniref:Uncharacterized protein n=1 Tax=Mycena metata TaxID=1033252 RepID=A0AAD7NC26_9AGAR|nr:hypothetical protein B0H16DRAFT_1459387 [Mycena metata]
MLIRVQPKLGRGIARNFHANKRAQPPAPPSPGPSEEDPTVIADVRAPWSRRLEVDTCAILPPTSQRAKAPTALKRQIDEQERDKEQAQKSGRQPPNLPAPKFRLSNFDCLFLCHEMNANATVEFGIREKLIPSSNFYFARLRFSLPGKITHSLIVLAALVGSVLSLPIQDASPAARGFGGIVTPPSTTDTRAAARGFGGIVTPPSTTDTGVTARGFGGVVTVPSTADTPATARGDGLVASVPSTSDTGVTARGFGGVVTVSFTADTRAIARGYGLVASVPDGN